MSYFSFRAILSHVSYVGVPQVPLKVKTLELAVSIQCPHAFCPFPSLAPLSWGQDMCTLMLLNSQQWMMWDKAAVHLSDEHLDFLHPLSTCLFVCSWQELFLQDLSREEAFWLLAFTWLNNWDNPSDQCLGTNPKIPRIIYLAFYEASDHLIAKH